MENNTGVKHDLLEIKPQVGVSGLWSLKSPYTSLVDPNVEYTCIAVNNISGMIAQGLDPKKDIYLANGDTEDNYLLDEQSNRCIIQLQSGSGTIVTVPNSAVNLIPQVNGINYISVVLGVSLSVIPDYLDLESLKTNISNLVLKSLGVKSTVFETIVGGNIIIDHDKHKLINDSRSAIVANSTNDLLENMNLKEENRQLRNKLTALEQYIKSTL